MVAGVACGGITELTVQAPGAVGVYANIDGAGWEQLTATGSDASYSFDVYSTYEVGEQCLNPDPFGSNLPPQPYSYEVLATVDDDESPLQLLACGNLPAPLTLDVEMQQPGRVVVGNQEGDSGSATGPWTATFQVAAARYDIAATDGTRVAVVRDVNVDADTTVTVDLDTDGTALETFPVAVSGIVTKSEVPYVLVLYTPDNAVRGVISPTIGWSAEMGSDGTAQVAAVPPSGFERTDAQVSYGQDADPLENRYETAQTATLDSHDLVFLPLPQFNVGNGRVAGTAIGSAASVYFYVDNTARSQNLGAVWMTRRWLDSTSTRARRRSTTASPRSTRRRRRSSSTCGSVSRRTPRPSARTSGLGSRTARLGSRT
jgi:hypothetical protein